MAGVSEHGQPSRTALGAAMHRAVHQILEAGAVFSDPFAVRIAGADSEGARNPEWVREMKEPDKARMRMHIAIRSRFAEACVGVIGAEQVVILGAGLDTFAHRCDGQRYKVFEVDFPATQEWKKQRLEAAGMPVPPHLVFAPCDFEKDTLQQALLRVGFDPQSPAVFVVLGVVPYLTRDAVFGLWSYIGSLPNKDSHIVFDCGDPPENLNAEAKAAAQRLATRVGHVGEPFKSYFTSEELLDLLTKFGFVEVEDLTAVQMSELGRRARGEAARPATEKKPGPHVVRASTRRLDSKVSGL